MLDEKRWSVSSSLVSRVQKFTKTGVDTGNPEWQQSSRSQLIRIYMRIYRKIRQIKEIVEYRRFALFFLPGQQWIVERVSKWYWWTVNKTDTRYHFIDRQSVLSVTRVTGYRNAACMKPEQPLFSLVLEPAQRAAFTYWYNALAQRDFRATRETTRRLGSWLFGWERDLSDKLQFSSKNINT